jgi:hypothetical protein
MKSLKEIKILSLVSFITVYNISYPGTKLHTHTQNFIPRYKTSHPGTKLHTHAQKFIPRYKTSHPGTKLHTHTQKFIPLHKNSYPGTKLNTQVQIFLLKSETGLWSAFVSAGNCKANSSDAVLATFDLLLRPSFQSRPFKGFFVECGALDGETRSNTLTLERRHGWRGVLIEADPENLIKAM